MNTAFRPGDQVFWWKRAARAVEYPYRAEVVAIGARRVTIAVEDPDGGPDRIVRHVAAECLQFVGVFHEKASAQGPAILEPAASWGPFTRYVEVGEDLHALRQVDFFENGNMLSYDRTHWVDDFGMLGDARINRNRKQGLWGSSEEIGTEEFEQVWGAARRCSLWQRQVATAQMENRGAIPVWLTIPDWRPSLRSGRP